MQTEQKDKPRILIVDDERENLTSFKYLFDDIYDVYMAESAAEGREILQQTDIQVVITDQRMPEVTGVEFLEQVLKDYPNTIRMILTGYSDFDAIIQAVNKGKIYYYFSKPWNESEMQMIIDNALEAIQLRQSLRQNEECFLELSSNIQEVFWLISTDWKTLHFISPTLEKAFGVKLNNLSENPLQWLEYVLSDDLPQVETFIAETRSSQTAESYHVEFRVVMPDLGIRWLSFRLIPVKDHRGKTYRYAGLMENITEKMIKSKTRSQTEQMSSARGFAAGLAHELNNPLSAVINGTQMISTKLQPEKPRNRKIVEMHQLNLEGMSQYLDLQKIHSRLDEVRKAGIRASQIIKGMLTFSQSSNVDIVENDIEVILDHMISMVRSDLDLNKGYDTTNINIRKNVAGNLPVILCNEVEIGQVIFNLLKNAVQAIKTAPDKTDGEIQVQLEPTATGVRFEITDNGPGMEPTIFDNIFRPFFTTKPKNEGTGLGLSIAHNIVNLHHNGDISVRSKPGEGTTFIVHLPTNTKKE